MYKNKKQQAKKLLTETELELMTILWKTGEGSVADVMKDLPSDRDLAYTSVSTILRILEQKNVIKSRKEGRGHIYIPLLQKSQYEVKTVKHMVSQVFDGTPVSLVRKLLEAVPLDPDELNEIQNLVDSARGRK